MQLRLLFLFVPQLISLLEGKIQRNYLLYTGTYEREVILTDTNISMHYSTALLTASIFFTGRTSTFNMSVFLSFVSPFNSFLPSSPGIVPCEVRTDHKCAVVLPASLFYTFCFPDLYLFASALALLAASQRACFLAE